MLVSSLILYIHLLLFHRKVKARKHVEMGFQYVSKPFLQFVQLMTLPDLFLIILLFSAVASALEVKFRIL
jgi:hypothetical protein